MRYGDLRITVPRGNPELLRDREHLLALRDVFDARPPLNWSVGTPTAMWEGVTLSGAPPRVTGLDLTERNLAGEIWGYLGDLVGADRDCSSNGNRTERHRPYEDAVAETTRRCCGWAATS